MKQFISIIFIFIGVSKAQAQSDFYDNSQIQAIHIYFSQSNWDYQLDTAKAGAESFILADSVVINGVKFLSVGVKYKGNSSYNASEVKNPLHISLNETFSQNYQGYQDIKLSNGYGDPSAIREVLAYDILKDYMVCPKANFANVFINDNLIGLYTNVESISKNFLQKHFYSNNQPFFKCNPVGTVSPTTKSNLRYISADSTQYFNYYQLLSNYGWSDLIALCSAVTNNTAALENLIDVDRSLWILAFNNVFINLDSYSGVFAQNYYLYQDNNGYFNPIMWDLNMSFGSFPFLGSGNTSMGSLTNLNMEQLPVSIHSADPYWPLIKSLYANPLFKKMYFGHIKTLMDEKLTNGAYLQRAQFFQNLIHSSVLADTNDQFSDAQFNTSLTTAIPFSSYTVPGIQNLMTNRLAFLSGTSEINQTQAQISAITTSPTSPAIGQTVTISAHVSNASAVYFGYRTNVFEHFTRMEMFDDGQHNDGSAGDQEYGFQFVMNHALIQYYIYAENALIGKFSPERAEYEYYTLYANMSLPQENELVFNEILANNVSGVVNENGLRKDWLEVYNNSSTTKNLFGLFLSDDKDELNKYAFPINGSINGQSTNVVWMDNALNSVNFLHANFSLSNSGETVYLTNSQGLILDSITYPTLLEDVSYGRCPDGTGPWGLLANPSFNAQNCNVGLPEIGVEHYSISPNPFANYLIISSQEIMHGEIQILNLNAQVVLRASCTSNITEIATDQLHQGMYLLQFNGQTIGKILKI
ncbi:MAG: hypothetical protein RL762_1761 [Bacteroidota bacterium]|jgi:hypothetical protein